MWYLCIVHEYAFLLPPKTFYIKATKKSEKTIDITLKIIYNTRIL